MTTFFNTWANAQIRVPSPIASVSTSALWWMKVACSGSTIRSTIIIDIAAYALIPNRQSRKTGRRRRAVLLRFQRFRVVIDDAIFLGHQARDLSLVLDHCGKLFTATHHRVVTF